MYPSEGKVPVIRIICYTLEVFEYISVRKSSLDMFFFVNAGKFEDFPYI